MLTKGNDAKVQNEVMAQIVADTSAKWMKFTRLLPKQEIEENSQYIDSQLKKIDLEQPDWNFLRECMLKMYANPAINHFKAIQ